jgi:tRNA A37 threonylcarbamoyladenosine modification protein TsaB
MAWLFLDTHASEACRYGWLFADGTVRLKLIQGRPHRLLPRLAQDWKPRRTELEGVCVVVGPGSFSAVRTGVLSANLLARILGVPLVGVRREEAASLPQLARRLAEGAYPPSRYAAPIYDAEPNITLPRLVCS